MRRILKPALILMPCILVVNIVAGLLISFVSPLDPLTAMLSCAPGGLSDIPIIAADMGADASVVVVMQFVRYLLGLGVLPLVIRQMTKNEISGETVRQKQTKAHTQKEYHTSKVLLTLLVATVSGLIGKASPMPAGTIAFATFGSILFSCLYPGAQMPRLLRKFAQLLSGAYVGATIGLEQLIQLSRLGVPAVILIIAYTLACFGIGTLLTRAGCFNRAEGLLAATPAGASDMALISADIGVENANLIVLQVMRMITVVLVFPTILQFVVNLLA